MDAVPRGSAFALDGVGQNAVVGRARALAALGEGGQMVEIGKRDIWGAPAVTCERRDVAYSIVALDMLPALSNSLLLQRQLDGNHTARLQWKLGHN